MSDIAIKVENLGKSYLVGHNLVEREGYTALRDVLVRNARNLARKTRDMFEGRAIVQGDEVEEFWALKDVSFEIKQGDRVGIIGRNGAGKSTLLKILSRITEPTKGRIQINGRVASLLEVGTGFHPELSGRENVFLNGAILGMSRREIQRKFDEIVEFSEVEKFLDTPVKHYSSGMYVRLAFAVAAHLEPEILVIDEVLAVGDAAFQKKCLGKMADVASEGRTILFVSHNMAAVENLCESLLLIENGQLVKTGRASEILSFYSLGADLDANSTILFKHKNRNKDSEIILKSINISTETGLKPRTGENLLVEIEFDEEIAKSNPELAITVEAAGGQRVFSCATYWSKGASLSFLNGKARCIVENLPLIPGVYSINVAIGDSLNYFRDHIPQAAIFEVIGSDIYGTGKLPSQNHGAVVVKNHWC